MEISRTCFPTTALALWRPEVLLSLLQLADLLRRLPHSVLLSLRALRPANSASSEPGDFVAARSTSWPHERTPAAARHGKGWSWPTRRAFPRSRSQRETSNKATISESSLRDIPADYCSGDCHCTPRRQSCLSAAAYARITMSSAPWPNSVRMLPEMLYRTLSSQHKPGAKPL